MKQDRRKHLEHWYHRITNKPITVPHRTRPARRTGQAERDVLRECLKWLRNRGCLADRNNTGMGDLSGTGRMFRYGIKGGGDIFAVIPPNGQHVEIECKHGDGGIWSESQQKRAEQVRRVGGVYLVVHSVQELADQLEPLLPGLFGEQHGH